MKDRSEVRNTLFSISHAWKKLLQPRFIELGLTLGQGQPRILASLLQQENVTQRELADACHLEAATLSRVLDHMEKADLVSRQHAPDCRRSWRITLTEKGRSTAREVQRSFDEADDKIWSGFSTDEMEQLLNGLERIYQNLREL